jgi:hypothetical protein
MNAANHFMQLPLVDLHFSGKASEEHWEIERGRERGGGNREIIRDLYRENCVAEVAVHVAHMLRHRRDLLGRHSFGSPWVMQTADREERELEEASGATIYTQAPSKDD